MGRPPVDSEMARARLERPLVQALDEYAVSEGMTRPQAIRTILADWLRTHGFSKAELEARGPATEVVRAMDAAIQTHRKSSVSKKVAPKAK